MSRSTKFQSYWKRYQKWLKYTDAPMSFIEWRWGTNPPPHWQKGIKEFIKEKGYC